MRPALSMGRVQPYPSSPTEKTTMYTITKRLPKFVTLAVIALSAACSTDRVASPIGAQLDPAMHVADAASPSVVQQQAVVAERTAEAVSADHGTFLSVAPVSSVTYTINVNPTVTQSFLFGVHMVTFPANTICNPATSGYGSATWLSPC